MHNPAILNLRTLVGVYLLCWLWIQNFTLQNVITAYECIINTRKQSIKVLWASIFPSNPDERGIVANCTLPTRGRDYGNALIKFPHCDFYPKTSSPMAPTPRRQPSHSVLMYSYSGYKRSVDHSQLCTWEEALWIAWCDSASTGIL